MILVKVGGVYVKEPVIDSFGSAFAILLVYFRVGGSLSSSSSCGPPSTT